MKNDYSHLVRALQNNDSEKINRYTKELYRRLMNYLRFSMNAAPADAEDCIQDSLITAFRAIRKGRLKNPRLFYYYIQKICRNNYLNMQQKKKLDYLEELYVEVVEDPNQMQALINKEKTHYLIWCFNQLQDHHKAFIKYWYDHPHLKARDVAEHFDISVSNAWTRKHRLIQKLHECHKHKINL